MFEELEAPHFTNRETARLMTPIPRPLVSLVVGINIIHFMNVHGYLLGKILRYDPLSSRSAMSYFNSIRETKPNNQTHKEITILFFVFANFITKLLKTVLLGSVFLSTTYLDTVLFL